MYQEYQQARKDNVDPNEYLNKVVNGFNQQQRQTWETMIKGISTR